MINIDEEAKKQEDENLDGYAKQLFFAKTSDKRSLNRVERFRNDIDDKVQEKNDDKTEENEKYLEKIRNIEFSLDSTIKKESTLQEEKKMEHQKVRAIEYIPIREKTNGNTKKSETKNKGKDLGM